MNVKVKKTLDVIKSVLVWAVLAVSVCMMIFTLISVNTFDQTERNLFGYKFFIVQSDSMKATDFAAGDLIIVHEVDVATLKEEDVITFMSPDPAEESLRDPSKSWYVVTHKIKEVITDDEGILFRTYGTTTGEIDRNLVSAENVIGKYEICIPKLGNFFAFMRTVPGYIVCILVPFLLLIISQAVNVVRLFRQYRAEQMEALNAERKKLEEEREETRRMMQELLAMKEKMENTQPNPEENAESDNTEADI